MLGALLLADARRLALEIAQVVEARATDLAAGQHLHAVHHRRVQRKDTLDADAVRDLADGERGARGAAGALDANALEGLDALLLALLDLHEDLDGVTDAEIGDIAFELALLDGLDDRGGVGHG